MTAVALMAVLAGAAFGMWWWLKKHTDTPCGWCGGTGRNPLSTKNHQGKCRHCGGSGKRRSRLLGKSGDR